MAEPDDQYWGFWPLLPLELFPAHGIWIVCPSCVLNTRFFLVLAGSFETMLYRFSTKNNEC